MPRRARASLAGWNRSPTGSHSVSCASSRLPVPRSSKEEKVIMSNETNTTITTPADPTPAPPASVPDTLVAQIRAMRALIPAYQQLPGSVRKSLAVVAKSTNADFVQASINSIGPSPIVERAVGHTPDELRQDTADADNWTVVEDEARALLSGIVAANLVRRYRV